MHDTLKKISAIGIVPVIKISDTQKAVPLAKALCVGGLPAAEITFRTAQAEESIRLITEQVPEMLVGAGTVLTTGQADRAVNAGAKFIVSPGFNPVTVAHCNSIGVPVLPGCPTASDVEQAISCGLEVVKFFPAEAAGGIEMIKALAAPYHTMKFMPTGGINAANVNDYLAFDKVSACGGSWMVHEELIENGDFEEITRLTKEAVNTMLGFTVKHVGVNAGDAKEAGEIAGLFGGMLGLSIRETPISCFAGDLVEVMSGNGRAEKGHIAIGCNHVGRAIEYLKLCGTEFDENTLRLDSNGRPEFIYLKDEIAGFGVHLVAR